MAHPTKDALVRDELLADGSMVLFHPQTRQLVTLNRTAALVWEYCDGQHSEAAIADELLSVFPDATTVADDVAAVLAELREGGMLGEG